MLKTDGAFALFSSPQSVIKQMEGSINLHAQKLNDENVKFLPILQLLIEASKTKQSPPPVENKHEVPVINPFVPPPVNKNKTESVFKINKNKEKEASKDKWDMDASSFHR